MSAYVKELRGNTNTGVYVIYNPHSEAVKIGYSTDIENRMAYIQIYNPCPLELLHVIEGVGIGVEREMHRNLEKYRIHGEWFEWNTTVKNIVKKVKKQYQIVDVSKEQERGPEVRKVKKQYHKVEVSGGNKKSKKVGRKRESKKKINEWCQKE